jgi:starch synthase
MTDPLRLDVLTREYPPDIYGGAGVHVAELARALRRRDDLDVFVRCFGPPRDEPGTTGYDTPAQLLDANSALRTLGVDLPMAADCAGADVVHSHTWYAALAGQLASMLHGMPHVFTAHSLEPLRPWKAEQLGGGYAISSWAERTAVEGAAAVVGVSAAMRDDILRCYPAVDPARTHVVHNGIDTDEWAPAHDPDRVRRLGVDPTGPASCSSAGSRARRGFRTCSVPRAPSLRMSSWFSAPARRTPRRSAPRSKAWSRSCGPAAAGWCGLRRCCRGWTWWHCSRPRLSSPARRSTNPRHRQPGGDGVRDGGRGDRDGWDPEVVADGRTGLLVPIEQMTDGTGTPLDRERFEADLARALTEVAVDPDRAAAMGRAGRERAVTEFSWDTVAARTLDVYRTVTGG